MTDSMAELAVAGQISASAQNQALSALLFLCHEVSEEDLIWLNVVVRAKPLADGAGAARGSALLPQIPSPASSADCPIWIVRLARMDNAKAQMDEFAHRRADRHHFGFTFGQQAVIDRFNVRVARLGGHRR